MKLLFFISLLLLSNSSFSEWVRVGNDETGKIFLENKAIKRYNIQREFWLISNLEKPYVNKDKFTVSSVKTLNLADCVGKKLELIYRSEHSESYATGARVGENQFSGGIVVSGQLNSILIDMVCSS